MWRHREHRGAGRREEQESVSTSATLGKDGQRFSFWQVVSEGQYGGLVREILHVSHSAVGVVVVATPPGRGHVLLPLYSPRGPHPQAASRRLCVHAAPIHICRTYDPTDSHSRHACSHCYLHQSATTNPRGWADQNSPTSHSPCYNYINANSPIWRCGWIWRKKVLPRSV